MKVTRDTPEQLILSDTPWLIGIMLIVFILAFVGPGLLLMTAEEGSVLFGLVFALVGGGLGAVAFCVFVRRAQVVFDRTRGHILIRRQSVFGFSEVAHALADLSHAEIEQTTSRREGRTSTLYRPVLVLSGGMSAGRHPVIEAYSSGGAAHRLVEAVNAWLPALPVPEVDSGDHSA